MTCESHDAEATVANAPAVRSGVASAATQQATVALSIVAPMHNEAGIAAAFVRRCAEAADAIGVPWELIVCDDASTDDTVARLTEAGAAVMGQAPPGTLSATLPATQTPDEKTLTRNVRILRQPRNLGQIGATLAGLAAARGTWVTVLDGDLQDPPEVIETLWRAAQDTPPPTVVFAVKTARDDPTWFLVGRAAFVRVQTTLGGAVPPRGAGAFCLMPRTLAHRIARADVGQANLAPLVMAVLGRHGGADTVGTVAYTKAARYDGESRVGPMGLAREAAGSLELSGALGRGLRIAAAASMASAVGLLPTVVVPPVGLPVVFGMAWLARSAWRAGQAADVRATAALARTEPEPEPA